MNAPQHVEMERIINIRTRIVNATNGGDECKNEETEEVECIQFPGE